MILALTRGGPFTKTGLVGPMRIGGRGVAAACVVSAEGLKQKDAATFP